MWWFDTCIYCKIFTTIRLVNTFFTSHNHHLIAVMVRTLKQYSHSNFQVYRTVSLTNITMLCIRSLEIIHLVSASLCPWTYLSPCPPPYNHWEPPLCSLFAWFNVFTFHLWVMSDIICICVCLTYFTLHNTLKAHPCCCKWQNFLPLYGYIYTYAHICVCIYIYNIIYVLYLIYPFVCWQTIWVVSMFWQMSWLLWLMPHEYWSKDISYIYLSLQISMQKWNHCITDWFYS